MAERRKPWWLCDEGGLYLNAHIDRLDDVSIPVIELLPGDCILSAEEFETLRATLALKDIETALEILESAKKKAT